MRVNRRAKNHEECKEPDSASTPTCQLDQMAVGLIQGPLKSMQIFVLISVALDQHLCTQTKVRLFSHKRTKSYFPFVERGEAPILSSLLCSWDSPSWCCCASWLVVLADPWKVLPMHTPPFFLFRDKGMMHDVFRLIGFNVQGVMKAQEYFMKCVHSKNREN